MKQIDAHNAKQNFGAFLDDVKNDTVAIKRYGRTVAVAMSRAQFRDYERLREEALFARAETLVKKLGKTRDMDEFSRLAHTLHYLMALGGHQPKGRLARKLLPPDSIPHFGDSGLVTHKRPGST